MEHTSELLNNLKYSWFTVGEQVITLNSALVYVGNSTVDILNYKQIR